MTSFISHSRVWLAALAVIGGIELAYWWIARPDPVARSNFLEHRFAQPEVVQRYFAYAKLEELSGRAPTILHVGDSSGFHAVIPPVVDALLPGQRYLNFGVATTLGYPGYYALAHHMLERHPTIRTLVVYFSLICAFPQPYLLSDNRQLIGTDLANDLIDPMRGVLRPPTLAAREALTRRVYYLNGALLALDAPRSGNSGYLAFRAIMGSVGGWSRETDNPDDIPKRDLLEDWRRLNPELARATCPGEPTTRWDWATMSRRTDIELVMSEFAELAARHGARLVMIANPLPAGIAAFRDPAPVEAEFRRFALSRPGVHFEPPETWSPDRFSVAAHVATPHSILSSERVARILAPVLGMPDAPAPPEPASATPDRLVLDATRPFSGYAWKPEPDWAADPPHRATFPGRSEALIHARVRPGAGYRLVLEVPPAMPESARQALTVSTFGIEAQHLGGEAGPLAFHIPEETVSRYGGFLEILLSLRGLTAWPEAQTTDRPDAEGLRLVRLVLERQGEAAPGVAAAEPPGR